MGAIKAPKAGDVRLFPLIFLMWLSGQHDRRHLSYQFFHPMWACHNIYSICFVSIINWHLKEDTWLWDFSIFKFHFTLQLKIFLFKIVFIFLQKLSLHYTIKLQTFIRVKTRTFYELEFLSFPEEKIKCIIMWAKRGILMKWELMKIM